MGLLSRLAHPFSQRRDVLRAEESADTTESGPPDRVIDIAGDSDRTVVDVTETSLPEKELVGIGANGKIAVHRHGSCSVRHRTAEAAVRCRNS